MKWFIFSDLHGSAYWCGKVMEALEREGADRILYLGDVFNHGPSNGEPERYGPPEVIDMLNAHADRIIAVRGNCDIETDQSVLKYSMLEDYKAVGFGDRMIYATHGHIYNENNLPPLAKGDILLHGHSHIPACEDHGDFLYLNPGSVALPKGGSTNSYMVMTESGIEWKDMDGNVTMTYSF
ncbi:MAG: phosphodiesterase [Oscillospiraceae bacterium]|nr:phosphodiesterase [Oscillospiraceae bacterium]